MLLIETGIARTAVVGERERKRRFASSGEGVEKAFGWVEKG